MKSKTVETIVNNEEYVRLRIYDGEIPLDEAGVELLRLERANSAALRSELAKTRDRGFNHGYLMAVANIINLHRETVVAVDVLLQIDLTIDDAESFELAEYDMKALNRLRAEPRAADFFKSQRSQDGKVSLE